MCGALVRVGQRNSCIIYEQWFASPACTELEAVVMDWAAKMFGLHRVFWNVNKVGGGVMQVR